MNRNVNELEQAQACRKQRKNRNQGLNISRHLLDVHGGKTEHLYKTLQFGAQPTACTYDIHVQITHSSICFQTFWYIIKREMCFMNSTIFTSCSFTNIHVISLLDNCVPFNSHFNWNDLHPCLLSGNIYFAVPT